MVIVLQASRFQGCDGERLLWPGRGGLEMLSLSRRGRGPGDTLICKGPDRNAEKMPRRGQAPLLSSPGSASVRLCLQPLSAQEQLCQRGAMCGRGYGAHSRSLQAFCAKPELTLAAAAAPNEKVLIVCCLRLKEGYLLWCTFDHSRRLLHRHWAGF